MYVSTSFQCRSLLFIPAPVFQEVRHSIRKRIGEKLCALSPGKPRDTSIFGQDFYCFPKVARIIPAACSFLKPVASATMKEIYFLYQNKLLILFHSKCFTTNLCGISHDFFPRFIYYDEKFRFNGKLPLDVWSGKYSFEVYPLLLTILPCFLFKIKTKINYHF